jgi:hypothetical protein
MGRTIVDRLCGLLVRTDRANHRRALQRGELHRVAADRAGSAGYQDRLSRDRSVGANRAMSRQRGNAEARAFSEADRFRQRCGAARRQGNIVRRSPQPAPELAFEQPNPFADTAGIDARAHRFDHAGAVIVGDRAIDFEGAARTRPLFHIQRIDAGGANAHQNLALAGLGCIQLADLQHLGGWPKFGMPGCAH